MRYSPSSQPSSKPFRPPLVSMLYSGAWSFATRELYFLGQQGWEWGTVAAFATGGIAISQLLRAADDWFKVRTYRRKKKKFDAGKKEHGQARFAVLKDIQDSEILSEKQGIFLGTTPIGKRKSRDVLFDGPGSVSAIAMPGQLKTMSLAVPTCMANPGQNGLILNDPTGEMYSICTPALEAMGYEVFTLSPFSSLLGIETKDAGLDIFSSLDPNMDPTTLRSRLLACMKWVMPGKAEMDEKSEFFYRSARMLGGFFALKEIKEGRKPTLPGIRRQLMEGPAYLEELFAEAEGSTDFGGVYEELARSLGGVLRAAPQQFAGGYGIAEQCLDPYDHYSALGKHTSGEGFDPRVLKDPNKKTALFLISTLGMMETISPTTAMTLTYLFDTLAADPQLGTCTAIIDECGSLVMPRLASSLLFYRKAGLRCLMIWQDMAQAEKNYGKTGFRQIMAASQIKIAMGIQEPEALEMFSKLCGTKSISDMSLNDRGRAQDLMPDLAPGLNHRSVPLIRPEEIRMMSRDQMLVVGDSLFPMILNKLPYWKRKAWKQIAGPSPYYRG